MGFDGVHRPLALPDGDFPKMHAPAVHLLPFLRCDPSDRSLASRSRDEELILYPRI